MRNKLRSLERLKPSQGTSRASPPESPPSDDDAHDVPSGGLDHVADNRERLQAPHVSANEPEPPGLPDEAAPLPKTDPGQTSAEEGALVLPLSHEEASAMLGQLEAWGVGGLPSAEGVRTGGTESRGRVREVGLAPPDEPEPPTLGELLSHAEAWPAHWNEDFALVGSGDAATGDGAASASSDVEQSGSPQPASGEGFREEEKAASRAEDQRRLEAGEVTREQLNIENRFLDGTKAVVRYDLIEGGDASDNAETGTRHVAQPEPDSTSASGAAIVPALEQPPAHVLASLPAPGDVYEHLFSQLAERTREAYEGDLSALAEWLQLSSSRAAVGYFLAQPPERAQAIALGWLAHMQAQTPPLAPATQSRRLSAIKSVLKVARSLGVVSWTLNVKAPKAASLRDTDGFDVETAQKLLAVCGDGLFGLRNQILVRLLYVHALRRVEVTRILTKHFDGRRVLVHGKGSQRDERKIKWVVLSPKLVELVPRWIEEAKRGPDQQLLSGWRNKSPTDGITPHGVYAIVLALHKRSGVVRRTLPHQFRHSAVNELIDHKEPLTTAQSLLRHEDPRTTAGYYSNREDAALQAASMLEKILDGEEEIEE